jgi:hypothetical protein
MALVSQRKRPYNICGIRLDYGVQVSEQYVTDVPLFLTPAGVEKSFSILCLTFC